jgi:hypothetical protein
MNLGEVGWGDVDWIDLPQERKRWRAVMNSVMKAALRKLGYYFHSSRTS